MVFSISKNILQMTTDILAGRREEYNFQHVWTLNAPLEIVWNILINPENWESILYGSSKIDNTKNNKAAIENHSYSFTIKGRLPYSLSFNATILEIQHRSSLHIQIDGELTGNCDLKITEEKNETHLYFNMDVSPVKAWMRALAPIAKKLFIHNHNFVVDKSYNTFKNQIALAMN